MHVPPLPAVSCLCVQAPLWPIHHSLAFLFLCRHSSCSCASCTPLPSARSVNGRTTCLQHTHLVALCLAPLPAVSLVLHLQEMKIENIDTTLEEIQEVGEQMRVINEAISQPVGGFQVRHSSHSRTCYNCCLPEHMATSSH